MRRRILVAAVFAVMLAAAGLVGSAGAQPSADSSDVRYFTWMAAGSSKSLFTVVYDSTTQETSVLERDATTGRVRSEFGDGFTATSIWASGSGQRVYVAAADGSVRVFARHAGGFRQIAAWTISVPGESGAAYPNGVIRTRGGLTLVAVTVGNSAINPPSFAGVVALDRNGSTVATWSVPDENLPQNAFVLPATISRSPTGEVLVGGIPCQAGLCGSPVNPGGWLYELVLSKGPLGSQRIETGATWTSDRLVAATSLSAITSESVLVGGAALGLPGGPSLTPGLGVAGAATTAGGAAQVLSLRGGQVQLEARLPVGFEPSRVTVGPRQVPQSAYLIGSVGASDTFLIQRFAGSGSSWARQGRPWRASWGPSGPPVTTCAGRAATIVGTSGPDVITGTPARDIVNALGGNDVVRGLGGNDLICLGGGVDVASGGPGADAIFGNAGADLLRGGVGRDRLLGGGGFDVALGGPGRNRCFAERTLAC